MLVKRLKAMLSVMLCVSLVIVTNVDLVAEETKVKEKSSEKVISIRTDKISSEVHEEISKGEEYIQVYLWYEDIDQMQVEVQVADMVGISTNNIEMDFVEPSDELIDFLARASTGNVDDDLEAFIQEHLERTAVARAIEKERTDLYIDTRRAVSREKYNEKSNLLISELGINNESIMFKSQYSPMMIANLSVEQIMYVAKNNKVTEINLYYDIEAENCTPLSNSSILKSVMGVEKINNKIALTGVGVKVGIHENSVYSANYADDWALDNSKVYGSYGTVGQYADHATMCASIVTGYYGIAPNAQIYSTSTNSYSSTNNFFYNIEKALTNGVNIISISAGNYRIVNPPVILPDNFWYSDNEKYIDHIISKDNVTVVVAAGNEGEDSTHHIRTFSLGYNSITVGSFNDNDTITSTDDHIFSYSSWYNNGNGCYKPDVVANGNICGGGTSSATPVISGMLALLYEYKPSLAAFPHVSKAILLASVHQKASTAHLSGSNESMISGLTPRQGAGIPNMYTMISIAAQKTYGYSQISSERYSEDIIRFNQPKYGAENINVSLAYLREVEANIGNGYGNVTSLGTHYDLDLYLYQTGSYSTSLKSNSSTELIYAPLSNISDDYRIRVYNFGITYGQNNTGQDFIRYAVAWSTNNLRYRNDEGNYCNTNGRVGVYYIRNKATGKYLSLNNTNRQLRQVDFSGAPIQKWIVTTTNNSTYTIKTADTTMPGFILASSTTTTAVNATNGNQLITFVSDNNLNTLKIKSSANNSLFLGITGNSYDNNALANWGTDRVTSNWYFEKIAYIKGDVNYDGVINATDITLVTNYSFGSIPNDLSFYLADCDSNGIINAVDIALVRSYVVNGG